MKKFLLSAVIFLVCITSQAQEQISEYNMSYFEKDFSISAVEPENGDFTFYIETYSTDGSSKLVTLMVEKSLLPEFKQMLTTAKDVFVKWKQAAIENDVSEVDKEIETEKVKAQAAFYYGSKWNFDFSVNLNARFKIINGKHLLIIENAGKLQSSSNRYIDSTGFSLVFNTPEEVEEFISKLNEELVTSYFASKKSKEDVFKQ